ncbi:hypothetical protein GUJ93_ZPchr0004g39830, partial [Zizania palustris]
TSHRTPLFGGDCCVQICSEFIFGQEDDFDAPTESRSARPISNGPVIATTILGIDAPTLMAWLDRSAPSDAFADAPSDVVSPSATSDASY